MPNYHIHTNREGGGFPSNIPGILHFYSTHSIRRECLWDRRMCIESLEQPLERIENEGANF